MHLLGSINKSMNMIHDIDDHFSKSESLQQLQPVISFGKTILTLETNPEILDNIANYISCSMEVGSREMSDLLHHKATELRQQFYDFNKPNVSILFNNDQEISEERTMRR